MLDILFSPVEAIIAASKKRLMGHTFLVLIVSSIMWALSAFITGRGGADAVPYFFYILFASFIGVIFVSWLLKMFLGIVVQKGNFFDALTTITYGFFVCSITTIIALLFTLIPQYIGYLLFMVIMIIGMVLTMAVLFKSGMTLFKTDLMTTWIAVLMIEVAIIASLYYMGIMYYFNNPLIF